MSLTLTCNQLWTDPSNTTHPHMEMVLERIVVQSIVNFVSFSDPSFLDVGPMPDLRLTRWTMY